MKICPKCGYQKTKNDDIYPDHECLKCGVIYAKANQEYQSPKKTNNNSTNKSSSEKRYHNKNYLNDEHEYAVRGTRMTPKKWIIFFIAATLVMIIGFLGQKHYGGSDTKESKTGDVHGAWAYMQLFVKKRLKSPQSADFPFGGYRHVTELGAGRHKVNSYVDSQNSFGASIRTHFEGVIKKTDGGWELEYLNFK